MEGISYDYFKSNFGAFCLRIIKIKKFFIKKYILFEMWDGGRVEPTYVEKCTDDLRKMYKSIKEHFPNFPITDKHEDNIASILSYCKDEWLGQHYFILEFLYAFLFKSKNHNNIERPKTRLPTSAVPFEKIAQTNSFSDDQGSLNVSNLMPGPDTSLNTSVGDIRPAPAKATEDATVIRPKVPSASLKLTKGPESAHEELLKQNQQLEKERLLKVFQGLFQSPKAMCSASFPRILLFEKKLLGLSLNKPRSELFQVKFKLSNESVFLVRFVMFTEKIMYFYENSRDYIRNRDAFLECFPLVKLDKIKYTELPDGDVLVEMSNECTLVTYQFVLSASVLGTFLLTLCIQLLKKESIFVKTEDLPTPFNCLGDFVLKIEEKNDASKAITDDDRAMRLSLSYLEMDLRNYTKVKRFILPIMNQLDILYMTNMKKVEPVEMTRVYDLNFSAEQLICSFPFFNVSVRRLSDYTDAFIAPIIENYHETLPIESGFKKSIKELQVATFRIKRLFAFRDFLIEKWTEFLCFKFPFFTNVVFALSLVFVITFGFESFFVFALLSLIFYFNPYLNKVLAPLFAALFFRPDQVNRHYIFPKNPQERMKRKEFYLNMANVQKRFGDKQKLTDKLMNAYDFSSRVPQYIHCFIDYFEKFKNIVLWRNYRKTEASVFYFVVAAALLYFTSKQAAFVYWICFRVWYGYDYYKRVLKWNRNVIEFLVRYFISDILEFEGGTAEDFFAKNRTSLAELITFSKEFAKFVEKWLDVKLPEDYWKNHFSLEQISEELIYSHKRIILPFYEEKRKPAMFDMVVNFLYSTPSDYYYYVQQKVMSGTSVKDI